MVGNGVIRPRGADETGAERSPRLTVIMGDVDPVSAVMSALAALDAAEDLGAVVDRDDAAVLDRSVATDRSSLAGVLHGRTVTVKDWIDVTGFVCEGEQQERTGRRPTRDATVVARLRVAGAIVVAKTQPGGDHAIHGRCHHPLDPTRTPGGTSSGEAALIGRGASTLGLGSDSGGSIRLPEPGVAWLGSSPHSVWFRRRATFLGSVVTLMGGQ